MFSRNILVHRFLSPILFRVCPTMITGKIQDTFWLYTNFHYVNFYNILCIYNNVFKFIQGQQRSASVKKNYGDQSADNWPADPIEPKVSFSKQRIPAWNHKFFLLDNEAQTVHALRPFNPLELLSMNLNQMKPSSSALTRPIFAKQTVRMTVTDVSSVTTTKICIPSNLFLNATNPTVCPTYNRTRRFIDLEDDLLENDDVFPTTVNQEKYKNPNLILY